MADDNNEKVEAFKKLVDQYNTDDKAWEDAKAAQEKAFRKRSDTVAEIAKLLPSGKRRVKINGQVVSIVCRTSKKAPFVESWFFKGFATDDDVFGDE